MGCWGVSDSAALQGIGVSVTWQHCVRYNGVTISAVFCEVLGVINSAAFYKV